MPQSSYKIRGTKVNSPHPVELTPAELRLVHNLERHFAPENIFADCYFPQPDPSTDPNSYLYDHAHLASVAKLTQIDCLAIDERGIFVFESKDYSGWIYGNGRDRYWTETLNFGQEKHRFYNPIKQNQLHIDALRTIFPSNSLTDQSANSSARLKNNDVGLVDNSTRRPNLTDLSFFSFIVFGPNATLKTISNLPENCHICLQPNIGPALHSISTPHRLNTEQIANLRNLINHSRIAPTALTRQTHITESHPHQRPNNT